MFCQVHWFPFLYCSDFPLVFHVGHLGRQHWPRWKMVEIPFLASMTIFFWFPYLSIFSLLLGIFPLSLVDVVLPYGSVCSPSFFPGFSLFCLYLPPCTPKALRCTACGILFAWTGIEFRPLSVKVQSPNHWTTREFPTYYFKTIIMYLKCLLLSWGPTTYSDF